MEIIDVDYTEVPDEPITETWYTCPSCGCITPTGKICSCGYHPPKAEPPKTPTKKQKWPIVAVAILAVALACSVFYNVEQHSALSSAHSLADDYERKITSLTVYNDYLREYNDYLREDVDALVPTIGSDYTSTSFRHNAREQNITLK